MKRRTNKRGISLLELLFTIALLTVVLVAFAAVYPSGYKLNRRSARATIAVETARAVAEEIQSLPFFDQRPPGSSGTIPTLTGLTDANNIVTFINSQMRTTIPEGFRLPDDGIKVSVKPDTLTSSSPLFATISVTIYWTETNDTLVQRNISVVTAKTANQVGR